MTYGFLITDLETVLKALEKYQNIAFCILKLYRNANSFFEPLKIFILVFDRQSASSAYQINNKLFIFAVCLHYSNQNLFSRI